MTDQLLYSTELLGLPVYDLRRRRIGQVRDAAIVPRLDPTRVDRFLVGGGWSWLTVRHDQVRSISLSGIYLRDENLTPYHSDEDMLRVERDLLDQQIIDAQGRKVVRITDITFTVVPDGGFDTLTVLDVDIGVRSIVRRLLQGVVPPRWVRRIQGPIPPHSIAWSDCDIVEPDPQRRVRLNVDHKRLESLHPADLADIVEELGPDDREAIFESIDRTVAAETLAEVEPSIQASIIESLEPEKAAAIMEEMSPTAAAHALADLEEETSEEILEEMGREPQAEVRELLEFAPGTAGGMMGTEFVALPERSTVGEAMATLRQQEDLLEGLNTLFLIDADERLCAAVPLGRLLLAAADTALKALASETLVHVRVDAERDRVTELFDKYNLLTLPVVGRDGRLAGTITADEVIAALRQE